MNEVAKYAGVSKITVSRVLSDPEKVSLKTREKVNRNSNNGGVHN